MSPALLGYGVDKVPRYVGKPRMLSMISLGLIHSSSCYKSAGLSGPERVSLLKTLCKHFRHVANYVPRYADIYAPGAKVDCKASQLPKTWKALRNAVEFSVDIRKQMCRFMAVVAGRRRNTDLLHLFRAFCNCDCPSGRLFKRICCHAHQQLFGQFNCYW